MRWRTRQLVGAGEPAAGATAGAPMRSRLRQPKGREPPDLPSTPDLGSFWQNNRLGTGSRWAGPLVTQLRHKPGG
jgi:hypothetical protein